MCTSDRQRPVRWFPFLSGRSLECEGNLFHQIAETSLLKSMAMLSYMKSLPSSRLGDDPGLQWYVIDETVDLVTDYFWSLCIRIRKTFLRIKLCGKITIWLMATYVGAGVGGNQRVCCNNSYKFSDGKLINHRKFMSLLESPAISKPGLKNSGRSLKHLQLISPTVKAHSCLMDSDGWASIRVMLVRIARKTTHTLPLVNHHRKEGKANRILHLQNVPCPWTDRPVVLLYEEWG